MEKSDHLLGPNLGEISEWVASRGFLAPGDVSDPGKILRDRCKGRAFDRAWHTYSTAFQEYFMALDRSQKSQFINANMRKVPHQRALVNNCMKAFEVSEKIKKQKLKSDEVGTSGVIQEEAETRMGGRDRLEKAVKRGLQWETDSLIEIPKTCPCHFNILLPETLNQVC